MPSHKRVDFKGCSFISVQGINQFYIYHQINFSISVTDSLHTSPFLGCFELPLSSYCFSFVNELNKTLGTWLFYVCMRVVFIFLKITLGYHLDGSSLQHSLTHLFKSIRSHTINWLEFQTGLKCNLDKGQLLIRKAAYVIQVIHVCWPHVFWPNDAF